MDGVDNETWFAKNQIPKKPYLKLGLKIVPGRQKQER
jgi:hypothetical protein